MKTCLVCGTALDLEATTCSSCGAEIAVQQRIVKAAGSRRFLFGHSPPPRQMSVPAKKEWQPPRRRPARRKKQDTEPGLFDPPKPNTETQAPSQPPRRREVHLPEPPAVRRRAPSGLLAALIDMILCLGLNALVLELVLLFSLRDVSHLIRYSLLPLMFVFLGFTVMYFWLFSGLFHKSLGRIIVETFQK